MTADLHHESDAAFTAALALHKQGQWRQAADLYRAILRRTPEHSPALSCLCLCQIRQGQTALAAASGRLAVLLTPGSAEAWHGLGTAQAAQDLSGEAVASFARMLLLRPNFAEGFNNLGNAQTRLGQALAAEESFRQALALKPGYGEAVYNLGTLLAAERRAHDALGAFSAALALRPDMAEAYNNRGLTLRALGRDGLSLVPFRQALRCRPNDADIAFNLGSSLRASGDALLATDAAAALSPHRLALILDPADADAQQGVGNALAAADRRPEAARFFIRALLLRPDLAEAHNNIGTLEQADLRHDRAVRCFPPAIALQPDYSHPYNNLAASLQALDRVDESLPLYRRARLLAPTDAVAANNHGIALLEAGHLAEAGDAFRMAVRLAPRRGAFYRTLADTGLVIPGDPLWQHYRAIEDEIGSLPDDDRMELHFALGRVYADQGMTQAAFGHLLAGNRLKRDQITYDEADLMARFDRLRALFPADCLAEGARIGAPAALPVFVVGMPRSGTSLVEQILASHPQIFGAGELIELRRLADPLSPLPSTDGPAEIDAATARCLRQIGADYLSGLRARAPHAARIVDKMPNNFDLLWLVALALPQARIIHVSRDPFDTCLSCFSKLFVGQHPYSYDLAELGRFYRAYQRLMRHWRASLPAGMMLELRYEDLVADMPTEARRLIAHCGLEWDPRCLTFQETRRAVRTASAAQVRRPLYDSAVGRWRDYAALAGPLIDALAG